MKNLIYNYRFDNYIRRKHQLKIVLKLKVLINISVIKSSRYCTLSWLRLNKLKMKFNDSKSNSKTDRNKLL